MLWALRIPRQSPLDLLGNVVCKQDGSLASEEFNVMGSVVFRTQPVSGVQGTNRYVTRGTASSSQIFNIRTAVLSVLNFRTDEIISKSKNFKIPKG
jgi:hypothetical protein